MNRARRAENAAERKRSRSEANTGRRTGLCFGLRLFFGRENRLRFSRRAGPSMGLGWGGGLGWNLGRKRVAESPCQRSARSPRMRRGRTASFTGRLGLNIRSPLAAVENAPRRMGAVEWVVLLRFVEPPGLRAGLSVHPRSAQPESDRKGHCQTGRTPRRCYHGVEAASKRRCSSLPRGGVRPARLFEPQEHN